MRMCDEDRHPRKKIPRAFERSKFWSVAFTLVWSVRTLPHCLACNCLVAFAFCAIQKNTIASMKCAGIAHGLQACIDVKCSRQISQKWWHMSRMWRCRRCCSTSASSPLGYWGVNCESPKTQISDRDGLTDRKMHLWSFNRTGCAFVSRSIVLTLVADAKALLTLGSCADREAKTGVAD